MELGRTTPTSLFRELDPVLWREVDNNPIALLQQIPIDRLEERASRARPAQPHQLRLPPDAGVPRTRSTRGARGTPACSGPRPVAYFSAEFGLHESLPIYSGGLGILAGDHIKSASDLGIPLVGVGLYYDQGYFRQRLDDDGWQHEDYIDVDHRLLPMEPAVQQRRARRRVGSKRAAGPLRPRVAAGSRTQSRCCCSIRTSTATRPKIAS